LTVRRGGSVSTACGFDVNGSQTRLFLSQVDIRDNNCATSFGYGAIYFYNASLMSLDDVRIENNTGFYSALDLSGGSHWISGTVIANNTALYYPGNQIQSAFLSVNRSAITGNRAGGNGGGLYLSNVSGGVTNTTIAENSAPNGGGLYLYYSSGLIFSNDTIARNSATNSGGGVSIIGYSVSMRATLIGANAAPSAADVNCGGSLQSLGYILVGDITACAPYYYSAGTGDQVNVSPGVGVAIDISGTRVVPLLAGSPAIDAGGPTCPATDGRGAARPIDGNGDGSAVCDIGAYEHPGASELSLAGLVYADRNLSGAYNAGAEPGVPGVTITLLDLGAGRVYTALTASDGSFGFGALTTGTFVLREVQPFGYDDGADALGTAGGALGNDVMTVSLAYGTQAISYTFGELPYASVSGTVYLDVDGNGLYNPPGDGTIFGVALSLAGTSASGQAVLLNTTTNGNGFNFFPVPPGVYTLTEAQPFGYFDGDDAIGTGGGTLAGLAPNYDIIANIAVTYGVPVTGYLFAEYSSRSAPAFVYADLNASGAYEYVEFGISNVPIQLTGITYRGAAVSLTVLTDYNGSADFGGLAPGVYTLTETQPMTWADGLDTATGNGIAGNDVVTRIVLTGTTFNSGARFGELLPGISGLVFIDANGNGRYDSETGLAGISIWMAGLDATGAGVWTTTTTDSVGRYFFTGVSTGTYTLTEQQPAQFLDGFEQVGAYGGITGPIGTDAIIIAFAPTTAGGQPAAASGNTFAELNASSVEGFTFIDSYYDGYLSYYSCPTYCDTPLFGVTIVLTGVNDAGQSVWMTTTTTTGTIQYYSYVGARFVFTPLRPGVYSVIEQQPPEYLDGPMEGGSPYPQFGVNRFDAITLTPGTKAGFYNFGEYPPALAGFVYRDTNNDGIYQRYAAYPNSESGLNYVGITLTYQTITGATGIRTAQTDNQGRYAFTGLVTGTYTITEWQPSSYADGREGVGDLPSIITNDMYAGIAYTPGVPGGGFNFGELFASSLNVIVYYDRNANGANDSLDLHIYNITVTLTGTTDSGASVGPITLNSGPYNYSVVFGNLSPGVYSVVESQPPGGYVDGPSIIGNYFGGIPGVNRIDAITIITPGTSAYNYAFTELKTGISGFLYQDNNKNHLHDTSETSYPSFPAATVALSSTDGGAVFTTTLASYDGFYVFGGIPAGTYQMTSTQAAGLLDSFEQPGTINGIASGFSGTLYTDIISGIVYPTSGIGVNYNFADLPVSHIRGTVYHDLNNNGSYDQNSPPYEPGLRGVTITLTGIDDVGASVYLTRATDASGNYDFATLRPGLYTLTETQPLTYTDGRESAGYPAPASTGNDRFQGITITVASSDFSGYNFGELLTGLYGWVFRDANNDGLFNTYSDGGLYNAQIILSGTTVYGQAVLSSTVTDGYGKFYFGPLITGTYSLIEPQPTGYLDGIDTPGSLGGITSTLVNGNDIISGIVFTEASYGRDYLFGELTPAQVNGIVFLDLNDDGYYAYSEPGILSATLTLSGTNDRGQQVIAVTYTNASGYFYFGSVRPGTYTLSETQPAGYLDGKERNPSGVLSIVNDTFTNLVVYAGYSYSQYQFGESGSFLSGYVYQDRNNDGIRAGYGDTGIPNVTIYLTGTQSSNGAAVGRVAQTDSAGVYQFVNVPNGTYTITAVQPAGYFDGKETLGAGAGGIISGNDRFISVTMTGPGGTNYNFAEIGPSIFAGAVYFDLNDNGIRDQNEPPIPGATLVLRGTDYLTAPVWLTTTTTINGLYSFTNTRMGVYTVTEVQPNGFVDGKDSVGCCGGGTLGNDAIYSVTLLGADYVDNYSFGERISGLSGYVYRDSNNNGLRDEGGYAPGATPISLFGFTTLGQLVTRTTTTNYGFYYFNDLITGTYRISETQPALMLDGKDTPGNLGGAEGANDEIVNIVFQPGQYGSEYNFGEIDVAYVNGTVYWDINNDGQQQGGEPNITGATVILSGTNDLYQTVRLTLTTAGFGFSFDGLRPGLYSLIEIQPSNYTDGIDAAGNAGGVPNGVDTIGGINLAPAFYATGYLFGERQVGLTGYVFRDLNNDGARQIATETGIPDTLVALDGTTTLGDPINRTAVTNQFGFYAFGDLLAGTYRMVEYQPNGYFDGKEQLGTLGGAKGQDTFTVTFGVNQFGAEYNFGELPPAALAGLVYLDINNNATRQNNEPGLPLVDLSLNGVDDLGAAVFRATQTAGYGSYNFANLRPGVYTITEQQPAGYTDGQDALGNLGGSFVPSDTFAGIVLGVAGYGYGYDFGEMQTGLGGFVFVDVAADGYITSESGYPDPILSGVTLILTGTPAGGSPITRTAQTDSFGFYSFGDLAAGAYRIRQIPPPNYLDGPDFAGSGGGTPGPLGEDYIDVNYAGGVFRSDYNFSEYPPNTLRGYVYFDLNDNGIFEWPPQGAPPFYSQDWASAETPVGAGVKIVLTGRNDLGQSVWTTDTTDTSGQFNFPLLRPGVYTLTEIQRDVDVDGLDRAYAPEASVVNDQVRGISLTVGQTKGAAFGEKPSIVGFIYRDDNDNGNFEPSPGTLCNSPEVGIGGVSLQLTGVDIYNNNVTLNATSFTPDYRALNRCNQGIYYWGGLVTGTYAIREFQPAGYLDGRETVGTGGGLTLTNDIISRIVFTPGVVITGYNFGEQRNVIGGYVYLDTNGNGVRDSYESGIDSPAVILLTGINNLGQAVAVSITTQGTYLFTGLRPGTYTLTESQPAGYADGQEQLGIGAGGAIGANDQFVNLNLAPGAYATDYNFGELINASIGGRVAYVWSASSAAWAGQGLVSQTLRLNGIPSDGGNVLMTATTDASGYYRFIGLAPGFYTVTQLNFPTGYADFGVSVCDYRAAAQGRSIGGIPLQYGTNTSYCDFKLGPTLTGYVFADDNVNSAREFNESGINDVTISAYGRLADGSLVTQSVATDYNGFFAFGGLLTGTYRLVEAQPYGFYDGNNVAGSLGGLTGTLSVAAQPGYSPPITNDIIAGIVYTPNAVGANYLFAELRPARIRGHVYYDIDDNGVFGSPPDPLVDPVDVYLDGLDDLGASVRMTNTGRVAGFIFSGLRPGTYTLTEIQPPTYTDWVDNVGTNGGVLGNDQIRFINVTWGDDARSYNFGERKFGIIGTVFADRNNNGVYEPYPGIGDFGIAGVSVWLTGTTTLGAPVFLTYTTDSGGNFNFPDLQPGIYTLSETQPVGYADGLDTLGSLGGLLSNDRVSGIVVGDHSFGQNYAFGELPPSTLSGYVYVDANNDGYRGGYGEPGIAGVTITLQGQNTLGDPVVMVTRTNASGYYIFRAIPNGAYSLIETQPNFVDGIDRAGTGAGGVALDDIIVGIGFNQISDGINYNFGERPSALSGHVFWDENGNGTRELTETGLSPATLKLHGFDFNSQPVNKTTKTTFEGYYAFEALPGTYWIEEIQPFGYLNGIAIPGTLGGDIASPNVITNIVIGIGGAGSDYDFAEVAPTAVDMAAAMGLDLAFLQSASMQTDLVNKAGVGAPLPGMATLAGFPTSGPTFAYLGTGNMLFADQPNSGPNTFGLGDYARLALTFTVPTTATCMSMDFAFFSEEFPEFVGSQFNDYFDAFVDGQPIARDQNGNRISINSVFGATPANALGTTYDAATPRLRSRAALTPGATSVITFFVTDVSDTAYDSAVFIDKFTFGRPEGEACVPGANLPVGVVLTKTVGPWPVTGNPVCALSDAITVTAGTEVAYCYRVQNSGEYTLTTHTLVDSAFGPLFSQMPQELLPGETFEYITSRVETQTTVSVGTWTGYYSATFGAASSDVTTVTVPGPVITPTPAPGSATLLIMPGSAQTYYTQPITVAVMISGVTNLGGYEVALRFDPNLVTATNVTQGSFLTSTGRSMIAVPTQIGPDSVRFGAGTFGAAFGPSGSGVLAWVRIAPRDAGTATLTLSNTLATNISGLTISLTNQGGQLYVIHPGSAYLPRVLR